MWLCGSCVYDHCLEIDFRCAVENKDCTPETISIASLSVLNGFLKRVHSMHMKLNERERKLTVMEIVRAKKSVNVFIGWRSTMLACALLYSKIWGLKTNSHFHRHIATHWSNYRETWTKKNFSHKIWFTWREVDSHLQSTKIDEIFFVCSKKEIFCCHDERNGSEKEKQLTEKKFIQQFAQVYNLSTWNIQTSICMFVRKW